MDASEGLAAIARLGAGPGERFATIEIPAGEKPLQATVTSLPKQEDQDDGDAVLVNVDRWRGQMGASR